MIHERLSKQGRLDLIREYKEQVDWTDQTPRTLIQPGYTIPDKEKAK